jgi:hypothetical protein
MGSSDLNKPIKMVSFVAGILVLISGFALNLTERGIFAINPAFDSGFRSAVQDDGLELRVDCGKISAALELLVTSGSGAGLAVAWLDGGPAPKVRVSPDANGSKVLVYDATGAGVASKFQWPAGAVMVLHAAGSDPPHLLAWTLYTDEHPNDSSAAVESRRTTRSFLLACLLIGAIGGALLLWAGFRTDSDDPKSIEIKPYIVDRLLAQLEYAEDPALADLGRKILRSVLFENMTAADAIRRHSPDPKRGEVAFRWARQVFVATLRGVLTEIRTTYLFRLDRP